MQKTIIIILVTVVIAGAVAFYVGMNYGQSQAQQTLSQQRQQRFQQFGGGQGGGGAASGNIISNDGKSITVQLRNGGSKIIFYSDSTKISKSVDGTAGDLAVGKTVVASGQANSDGSITAQTIQLRPQGFGMQTPTGN